MRSAAVLGLTGAAWFAYGLAIELGGDYQDPRRALDWATVYVFSAAMFMLALALPSLGRLASQAWMKRLGTIGGVAAAAAGVFNVLEDGLNVDWMFLPFILAAVLVAAALVAMAIAFALTERGTDRALALVPLLMLINMQLVHGLTGGVLSLIAWGGASVYASARRRASEATTPA